MNDRYVVAALGVWLVWGASWMAAGLWAARSVKNAAPRSFGAQLAMAFLGYGLLFFGPVHARAPLWIVPAWLGWTAVALVVAAMALAWWARIHLGALWSAGIIRREGHRVIESGPYAYVRHPIYTGILLGAAALAAVKATPMALIGALLIAAGFAAKARVEERFLADELGETAYADYRRVPMLVPFAPTGR